MKRELRLHLATLALFAALAAFHTWPLAAAPGTWSRNDNGDALLNEWTVAWVAHQLPRDPLHLFDANIFYPERRTLMFSEHLLPQSLLVAPVLWAGGSPVLAFNLSLLAGFALTAWAMCFVVRRWTGSLAAGVVAGSLAAFNAHTLTRLAHLQAQHVEFLPLALLALDRLLASPRIRHAVALGGWFALQALTSGYFLLFTAVAVASSAAVRGGEWVGARFRRVAPQLLLAAAVAGLVLLPFLLAYWQVRRDHGLVRGLGEITNYSASWTNYLATGALVHWSWSERFVRGAALFPGVTAVVLLILAAADGTAWRDRRARMLLAAGAVCLCLSFGTHLPFYEWLYRWVPLFNGIRAVDRFGQFFLVGLAGVAGFGAWRLLGRIPVGWRRTAVGILLVLLVNAEAWRGPLRYTRFEGIPRVFRTLANAGHAVVACFPLYWYGAEVGANGRYMLASTTNWQPMLNGYSGFLPLSYWRSAQTLRRFPEPASIALLRQLGVTHVVVDLRRLPPELLDAVSRTDSLRVWAKDEQYCIYELK